MDSLLPAEDVPATSIRYILSLLPNGETSGALTLDELGKYLSAHYNTDEEKKRNARHRLRDELYCDGGVKYMREQIDEIFTDNTVRELRKKWVPHTRFNNAIKRIVNELSTVYAEPAKRSVPNGDDNYQKLLEAVRMDEQMLHMSRLLNLHRALLVGFRVRITVDNKREPLLTIATPANVRAIVHPNDGTYVVAWMIRNSYKTARSQTDTPAWTLWTAAESMFLREDLTVIGESYKTHQLGVIPWVPVTLAPEASGFWPGEEGEDLVAAQTSIWMTNVLGMKETKSATKMPVITGDGTNLARGQAADSESPMELADGQSLTTVDMSMDTKMFREQADHVLENVGNNYGLSGPQLKHQGVQSAAARELMRAPLNEQRAHQQIPLRRFEARLVVVKAAVVKVDLPDMAFDPAGWRVEFGTPVTPLSPADDHNLFVARRAAGLDNTVDQIKRLHPGMSDADAEIQLAHNYEVEEERTVLARPIAAMNGGTLGGAQAAGGDVAPVVPPEQTAARSDVGPQGDAG